MSVIVTTTANLIMYPQTEHEFIHSLGHTIVELPKLQRDISKPWADYTEFIINTIKLANWFLVFNGKMATNNLIEQVTIAVMLNKSKIDIIGTHYHSNIFYLPRIKYYTNWANFVARNFF